MRFTRICRALQFPNRMAYEHKAKRPRLGLNTSEQSYFDSYSDIVVHEEMLGDTVRTNAYRQAIFNCSTSMMNKVVLDVGAGTGILSCFCAQAGAKKVYAVEASSIAEQAKKVIQANGLSKQVVVIQSLMEDVKLPEKVDIIVSEWMGYCLLYESMLSSVITARDRWLKPEGLMLPCSANMYLAPINDDDMVIEKVNFWVDMHDVYGVDMSPLLPFARKSISKDVMVKAVTCEHILSKPQLIASFDLHTVTHEDVTSVQYSFHFSSFGIADLQGFSLWFDVSFPSFDLPYCSSHSEDSHFNGHIQSAESVVCGDSPNEIVNHIRNGMDNKTVEKIDNKCVEHNSDAVHSRSKVKQVVLSTSPYKPETHWKQSLFYLTEEVSVVQDSIITGQFEINHCKENHRFLNISLTCKVDDRTSTAQSYFMGYELPKNDENNIPNKVL